MFQICAFGGHQVRLLPGKRVILTLFGGSDLYRATLARRLLACRRRQADGLVKPQRFYIITVLGGAQIKWPTLAEEFLDLREAVRGGAILLSEWDALMADLSRAEDEAVYSLTLFGGLQEVTLPSENTEVEALAVQRHLGNISESAGKTLEYGIGQPDAARRAILRQALSAA